MSKLDWINYAITFGGVALLGVAAVIFQLKTERDIRREREAEERASRAKATP